MVRASCGIVDCREDEVGERVGERPIHGQSALATTSYLPNPDVCERASASHGDVREVEGLPANQEV